MGALADSLKPKFNGCRFGELIHEHADDDDRAVIEDPDVSTASITEFVRANWGTVGKTVISEHRRGVCGCYQAAA